MVLLVVAALLLPTEARVAGVYTRLPRCTWKRCRLLWTVSQLALLGATLVSRSISRTVSRLFGPGSAPPRICWNDDTVVVVAGVVVVLGKVVVAFAVLLVAWDSLESRNLLAARRSR